MTIRQTQDKASVLLNAQATNLAALAMLYRTYAKEELGLPEEQIAAFIVQADYAEDKPRDIEAANRFLSWYFINHAAGQQPPSFSLQLNPIAWEPFGGAMIRPFRTTLQKGENVKMSCDPQDATFWSVYLETPAGGIIRIADAANQGAARAFKEFVHLVGKYSRML